MSELDRIRALPAGEAKRRAWASWDRRMATAPVTNLRLVHEVGDPRVAPCERRSAATEGTRGG